MFKFLRRQPAPVKSFAAHTDASTQAPGAAPPLSGGDLHVPRAKLSEHTLHLHYAINSLREELEAVIGVGWGESGPNRKGYRNGYYTREPFHYDWSARRHTGSARS